MSQIQVDNIYNKEATGSPSFPLGANVTGVITATTFKGGAEITSGTISATSVTAASGTFNGPVTIGGTLTYEDVTNIDSVGVITARNGLKVTAGGVDAVGVVTAGNGVNITGNIGLGGATYGTAGQVLTSGGSGANATWTSISAAPEISANASGNINAGQAVRINESGQFTGITSSVVASDPATYGVDREILAASASFQRIAYDPDNDIVFAQYKASNNNATRIRAIKLNSDGSWGTSYEGELSNQNYDTGNTCYAGQGRFVSCYRDQNNSFNARVVTINTSTMEPTVSSEITISGSDVQASNQPNFCIWHPPTNKILFVVRKQNENYYRTYTGSINYGSNTVDTWGSGSDYPFNSSTGQYLDDKAPQPLAYDPDTEKIIFCARRNSGTPAGLRAVAITIASNGGVTFGTEAEVSATANVGSVSVAYDTLRNKLVFNYRVANSNDQTCVTADVAANGNITLGTAAAANTAAANSDWMTMTTNNNGQFGVFWRDQGNIGPQNNSMVCRVGTINADGTITYNTQVAFNAESNTMEPAQSVYATTPGRVAIIFPRGNGYTYMTSAKIDEVTSNSAAYVGIANTTVTSGQSLIVRTFGGTSSTLSGLSTGSAYYIQKNGNFSTTADTPSVIGGVALNGTTMLVKS